MSVLLFRCRVNLCLLALYGSLATIPTAVAAPNAEQSFGQFVTAELGIRLDRGQSVLVRPDRDLEALQRGRGWRLVQAEDSHSAHHPGASSAGTGSAPGSEKPSAGSPASSSSSSSSSSSTTGGMMGEMMGRPRKELYPSLMEMPTLTIEQRRDLESQARSRINSEIDNMSNAEMDLRHALAGGDIVAADQASSRIRESLNAVQSGVTVLRSLSEGKPPQQIAQNWFKAQMNLVPPPPLWNLGGLLGISWFHVFTMGVLAIFSTGMLAIYLARMRRASALIDRLTRPPAPVPKSPLAPTAPPPGGAKGFESPSIASSATRNASLTPDGIGIVAPRPDAHRRPTKPAELWKGKLRVCAIYKETPSVKTFRLQDIEGDAIPFAFLPGQFLTYSAEIDGKTVRRSYTIASSAAQTAYIETTIKREDGGVFSDYMHGTIKEGDLIEVMAPSGAFTFTGREADSVVLIGGGVGITPFMAAIRYLSEIAWPGQIYLVYGAQTTEQFIFRDELGYLQRRMNNLHVAATIERATDSSWMGNEGQITGDFLKRSVPDLVKRRVHLCGPPGMMEALRKTLAELGVPPDQIKTEAFGPARGAVPPPGTTVLERGVSGNGAGQDGAAAIGPATATIRFAKSGKVAHLPPDKSVLEVAESIGVPIDYSCRAGICGVCKTHLLDGSVMMEVQDALTKEDKARGMILACQAKSIGNLIVEA